MKLEQQVVSLSLAKRLKELGVKQESYFVYGSAAGNWLVARSDELYIPFTSDTAAYNVAELGEMLPGHIEMMDGSWITLRVLKDSTMPDYWYVHYAEPNDGPTEYSKFGIGEAEHRGLMLAYLIENKLLTPNEEV